MKGYPYWKVIIGFALFPTIIGPLFGVLALFDTAKSHETTDPNPLLLWLAVSAVTALGAVFTNLIASLPLALLYAALRLRKGWGSYVFVALAGGVGAFLAMQIIGRDGKEYLDAVADAWMTLRFWSAFAMGAIASLAIAFLVLPKKGEV